MSMFGASSPVLGPASWRRGWVGIVAALGSATRGVVTHRMRTILSTLGIAIGVATLMTIYALVTGLSQTFAAQLTSLGSDTMYVTSRPWISRGEWWEMRNRPPITARDVDALRQHATLLGTIAPVASAAAEATRQELRAGAVRVLGTTSDYLDVSTLKVATGRFLSPIEGTGSSQVVILGAEVAERLFGQAPPLGERILLGAHAFSVVGVLTPQGKAMGQSQDNIAIVPLGAFARIYGARRNLTVAVAAPPARQFEAKEQIIEVLRRERALAADQPDNFSINQQSEIVKMFNEQTQAVFGVALAIGLITLLVGGIGVMNIMLVAVTERTREIGVRRALGAKKREIMVQFLAEAAVVTMIGGCVGTLLGLVASNVIGELSPVGASLSGGAMIGAIVFSAIIGLLFGTWPAYRAAQLDPIESLRYE